MADLTRVTTAAIALEIGMGRLRELALEQEIDDLRAGPDRPDPEPEPDPEPHDPPAEGEIPMLEEIEDADGGDRVDDEVAAEAEAEAALDDEPPPIDIRARSA